MSENKSVQDSNIFQDLKYLFKVGVLIANAIPVITGFWLAIQLTDASFSDYWFDFLLIILASTMVMAGALVMNNWYDVDIDTIMKRTQKRPTVTGTMSLNTVLMIGIVLSVIGMIIVLFVSLEAAFYAFIGWFTYVIPYTMWSKRRYTFNTIIGSVSGAVTPLIGWAAVASSWHVVPVVLALILFLVQMPHTYAIAIRKFDEYKAADVKMLPVVKGIKVTKRNSLFYLICLLPLPFFIMELGIIFVVLATLIHVGWIVIAIAGFYMKDDLLWANIMFKYSVYYYLVIFILMIVVTI